MNGMHDDRSLSQDLVLVLSESAPRHEPDHLLDSVLFITSRKRPRPRWLALIKEPPMRLHSSIAFGSPPARFAATMLVILMLTVLAASTVVAGTALLTNNGPVTPSSVMNGLIAFDSGGDIWVADPDGSHPRVLVGGPDEDTNPVWSPDGTQLAFWSKPEGPSVLGLGLVDANGGGRRTFEPPKDQRWAGYTNGESNIDWGPMDGRLMLKTAGNSLWLLDVASRAYEPIDIGTRTSRVSSYDWSDDGDQIAFISWDDAPHYEFVFLSDLSGSELRQLVKADPVDGSLASVRWDSEGVRLTYTRGVDDPAYDGSESGQLERTETSLYVFDTETDTESLIRMGRFYMPVWSPTGHRIAYGAQDVIGIVGADGSNPIPHGIAFVSPPDIIWSPDGMKVASVASTDAEQTGWRVVTIDVSGGVPTYIDAPGMVGGPSWQPILPGS